jgi:hypothetical protein
LAITTPSAGISAALSAQCPARAATHPESQVSGQISRPSTSATGKVDIDRLREMLVEVSRS